VTDRPSSRRTPVRSAAAVGAPGAAPHRLRRRAVALPGSLAVLRDVRSPQLHNRRDVYVYLPPSYGAAGDRRYPVLYMHDGQNLFDPALSFSGAWRVDLAMQTAARLGFEAVVVGVSNMGGSRLDEYAPFFDESVGGGGAADLYVDFLLHTLKPMIDAQFRTRPEPAATGILGSSMGGLVSLYAFFREPHAFGACGVLSPALWFGKRAILPFVEAAEPAPGRIWLDVGTAEGARTVHNVRLLRELLLRKGYVEGESLRVMIAAGAAHNEAAWGRRIKKAIPFLLGA
jgi:predicted alpha/beta superfamily hydrolase